MPNPNPPVGRSGLGKANAAGWNAQRSGQPLSANPYQDERRATEWLKGWRKAEAHEPMPIAENIGNNANGE